MSLTLVVHVDRTAKFLDRLGRVNIPYGASRALNETSLAVISKDKEVLSRIFHIRNAWVAKGYRAIFSTRSNLVAFAGHRDPYMEKQEMGGDKAGRGGGTVGVPEAGNAVPFMPRGTAGEKTTPKSTWPSSLLKSVLQNRAANFKGIGPIGKKGWKRNVAGQRGIVFLEHAAIQALAVRKAGAPRKGRGQFILLWLMPKKVHIPAIWGFRTRAEQTIEKVWPVLSKHYITDAIQTAKGQG